MTSVPEGKLKTLYANIKNFFILDVQAFVKDMNLDMSKRSSIYIVNDELQKLIISQMKLKKFKGVIYINKYLSEAQISSFRQCFSKRDSIRLILIDNGQFPQHDDIMSLFDEVLFYERFRKNKIVECDGFIKANDNNISNIIMDENEPDD